MDSVGSESNPVAEYFDLLYSLKLVRYIEQPSDNTLRATNQLHDVTASADVWCVYNAETSARVLSKASALSPTKFSCHIRLV